MKVMSRPSTVATKQDIITSSSVHSDFRPVVLTLWAHSAILMWPDTRWQSHSQYEAHDMTRCLGDMLDVSFEALFRFWTHGPWQLHKIWLTEIEQESESNRTLRSHVSSWFFSSKDQQDAMPMDFQDQWVPSPPTSRSGIFTQNIAWRQRTDPSHM